MRTGPVRAALLAGLALSSSASGWTAEGHRRVAAAAVGMNADLPSFFHGGVDVVVHASVDPDVRKGEGLGSLSEREIPEHYISLEKIGGAELPGSRADWVRLLAGLSLEVPGTGALPYAVLETTTDLALVLAEHRCWPADPHVRIKALLRAGELAHYAADLVQPLHTTVHHDGVAHADGSSPESGIHRVVDSLFETVEVRPPTEPTAVVGSADPWALIMEELHESHALVSAVYDLEDSLLALRPTVEARAVELAEDRFRAAVELTSSLFRAAQSQSQELRPISWLTRVGRDGNLVPCSR